MHIWLVHCKSLAIIQLKEDLGVGTLFYWIAVWFWTSRYLCLNFLICKFAVIMYALHIQARIYVYLGQNNKAMRNVVLIRTRFCFLYPGLGLTQKNEWLHEASHGSCRCQPVTGLLQGFMQHNGPLLHFTRFSFNFVWARREILFNLPNF